MSYWSEDLPSLGGALTEVHADLILHEAKRQYEALLQMRHRRNEEMRSTRGQTRVDLPKYYRKLFDSATETLDQWEKHRLLTICFAYKTKARVLQFLDFVDDADFPWRPALANVVQDSARDTAFGDVIGAKEGFTSCGGDGVDSGDSMDSGSPDHSREDCTTAYGSCSRADILEGAYFVITTLPLAFPAKFFSAVASHAPIGSLTVQSILSYPCVMTLSLSEDLRRILRSKFLNLQKHDLLTDRLLKYTQIHQPAKEGEVEASWLSFFECLVDNTQRLTLADGSELVIDDEEGGYELEDLGMWLAAWVADRQNVGIKEKGQETLLRMKLGIGSADVGQEPGHVELNPVGEVDKGGDKRVVRWNEDALVVAKEIPARPAKRRRKRKKY
jgi:hypothetical protein